jgi:cytochrome b
MTALDAMPAAKGAGAENNSVLVWDLGVRFFHWSLALAVGVCAYTGFLAPPSWLNVHLAAGTAIAALVVFRLVWGFRGSAYARFASFAVSPAALRQHIADISAGRRVRHLGHNQAGALMVYGLIAVLILLTVSGVIALGGAVKQGPLAFTLTFETGWAAREIHELLAFGLLAMIAAHWAGVAFESWRLRENLTRAMISGRKDAEGIDRSEHLPGAKPAQAGAILLAVAAVAVPGIAALTQLPAKGVPAAPLDPVYAKACGDCHLAYHPSLAPAQSWAKTMEGLADHFGENATLDAATAAKVRDYLAGNASERWDTRAANLLRRVDPSKPEQITAAPVWKRIHREIPEAVFKSKAVGAKGACKACHKDADTARFDPQSIAIPKDARS